MKHAPKKLVIVGGVAAGMSAAARVRRLSEECEIVVLERSGYVSYANCGMPYLVGQEISQRSELIVQSPDALKARFNLDVRVHHEVAEIDSANRVIKVRDIEHSKIYNESYDELILAVGAAPIRPKLEGIELPGLFTLRSIEDTESINSWIEERKPRDVVVAGAGFIGLEMAEQLARRGLNVTLVDAKEQVLTPIDPEMAEIVHEELRKRGIKLILESPIQKFREPSAHNGSKPPQSCWVVLPKEEVAADLVIIGLGIKPESALARKAGLAVGDLGGISVDEFFRTSDPHIWAVGDAIEVRHPVSEQWTLIALGGPANRQGRMVADNIFGAQEPYKGTIGTAILRVFDLTVATTGLNESQLRSAKIPYETVFLHPAHHAGYYPGAQRLDMKILFHKETGGLLGGQVIGKEGVDKRIDILGVALLARMSVSALADFELAYAPPFGAAKDPINLAGMAGRNVLDGTVEQIQYHELADLSAEEFFLLDVRSEKERQGGFIPNSMHIPLPELRRRLSELPKDKTVITYCQSGQRSYFAYRFLKQTGFAARSLSGGYLTWKSATRLVTKGGNLPATRKQQSRAGCSISG